MSIDSYHQDSKVSEMVTAAGYNSIFANGSVTALRSPVLKTKIPTNTHF